jgi:hypothetical protein
VSVTPLEAWSCAWLLNSRYKGPLFTVRDDTTTGTQDIYPRNGRVDLFSLLSFLGGHSGAIETVYGQYNGKNHSTSGGGTRPRIVLSGTLDVTANNTPTMVFAGAQVLAHGTALGMTGSPALTMLYCGLSTVNSKIMAGLGDLGTNNKCFAHNTGTSSTVPLITQAGAFRGFTASAQSSQHYYIAGKAASATPSAFTLEQDGTALSQASLTNGATAQNMTDTNVVWGHNGQGTAYMTGNSNVLAIWNAVLSGDDLLLARACGAAHM